MILEFPTTNVLTLAASISQIETQCGIRATKMFHLDLGKKKTEFRAYVVGRDVSKRTFIERCRTELGGKVV